MPGDESDIHARYIEATVPNDTNNVIRVASIYLPNGNPPNTDKYAYKLDWMDRLIAHAQSLLTLEEPLVIAGDYNVIPGPVDVYDPANWGGDALYLPTTRERFRALLNLGFIDLTARGDRRARHLHILGLPGWRLAAKQRLADRSSAAVADGGGSIAERRDRQEDARERQTLRSRADPG